jgi:hypothetical protein
MDHQHDAQASLILLVAVCEQILVQLAEFGAPGHRDLLETAERLRDLATAELRFGDLRTT